MKQGFFMCTYLIYLKCLSFAFDTQIRMAPDRGLTDREQSGVKGNKNRLTYAFTSNADGSEKLPPFIIGKPAKPRAFNRKTGSQLGFYYRNNAKAWMTAYLYQEWIGQWDQELKANGRKILLLQDNFSAHIIPDSLENIRVENFSPNLTAHVQPKDQGIIRCFKAHYRAKFIERAIDRYDEGITPGKIYEINQLQAMQMANAAWNEVTSTTIRNCWHKSGILPEIDSSSSSSTRAQPIPIPSLLTSDPVVDAEKQVEASLDDLITKGALQPCNRMDIKNLLNPAGESQVSTEASDEEIFQSVMDAIEARTNIDINGRDDVDDGVAIEPQPTRHEVLKAVSTISKYIDELDDPVSRKIEGLLRSFNRQLRLDETKNMKDTVLTKYF